MAANFKIAVHRSDECLHLKLDGDFDGSSAHELVNAINENALSARKIFIHTNGLRSVHPFGTAVFEGYLSLPNPESMTLIFTGESAEAIASELHGPFHCVTAA